MQKAVTRDGMFESLFTLPALPQPTQLLHPAAIWIMCALLRTVHSHLLQLRACSQQCPQQGSSGRPGLPETAQHKQQQQQQQQSVSRVCYLSACMLSYSCCTRCLVGALTQHSCSRQPLRALKTKWRPACQTTKSCMLMLIMQPAMQPMQVLAVGAATARWLGPAAARAVSCSHCCCARTCAAADRSSILASPKMMYVSEAGLLNTSGVLITNKICSSNTFAHHGTCPSQACRHMLQTGPT